MFLKYLCEFLGTMMLILLGDGNVDASDVTILITLISKS